MGRKAVTWHLGKLVTREQDSKIPEAEVSVVENSSVAGEGASGEHGGSTSWGLWDVGGLEQMSAVIPLRF